MTGAICGDTEPYDDQLFTCRLAPGHLPPGVAGHHRDGSITWYDPNEPPDPAEIAQRERDATTALLAAASQLPAPAANLDVVAARTTALADLYLPWLARRRQKPEGGLDGSDGPETAPRAAEGASDDVLCECRPDYRCEHN